MAETDIVRISAFKQIPPGKTRARKYIVADLFCGAGGFTSGAVAALNDRGATADLVALNHWPVAIDTHSTDHPEAKHFCQDISTVRPHLAVPGGKLDLLLASPACTFHSRASAMRAKTDQQRTDPWHIIPWLSELRVKAFIFENVPEFVKWGPIDPRTGRPIASKNGEYFNAWKNAIMALGFSFEHRVICSADHGDATTRERVYMLGRSDGKPIHWPEPTHTNDTAKQSGDLFGRSLKPWRPAREIIDFTIPGRSIFKRPVPLSPKTLDRVLTGAEKLGWDEMYHVAIRHELTHSLAYWIARSEKVVSGAIKNADVKRAKGILEYGPKRLDEVKQEIARAIPRLASRAEAPMLVTLRNNMDGQSIEDPLPTAAASGNHLAIAEAIAARPLDSADGSPLVWQLNQGNDRAFSIVNADKEPLHTVVTKACIGLAYPFILSQQAGGVARDLKEPMPGMTTGGAHALVKPTDFSPSSNPFTMLITHPNSGDRTRSIEESLPTITGANRGELAFIAASFGEREGQTPRIHTLENPMPTLCATSRVVLIEAGIHFDIVMRMLEPHELAAAMGFENYQFKGTKTQVTKQIGNAVSKRTAAALVGAMLDSVTSLKEAA